MIAAVRCGTLLTFMVVFVACDKADPPTAPSPSFPTQPRPQPPPMPPPPPAGQPPLTGPATTYLFSGPLLYPVRDFTTGSKYVLYETGAFSLQYPSFSDPGYLGSYRQENDEINFDFGADGSWDASGTLNGDLLEVRYSQMMEHSDFENAVYKRFQ